MTTIARALITMATASIVGTVISAQAIETIQHATRFEVRHGPHMTRLVETDHPSPILFTTDTGQLRIDIHDENARKVSSIQCDATAPGGTRARFELRAHRPSLAGRRYAATIAGGEGPQTTWTGDARGDPGGESLRIAIGNPRLSEVDRAAQAWLTSGARARLGNATVVNTLDGRTNEDLLRALHVCLAGWATR